MKSILPPPHALAVLAPLAGLLLFQAQAQITIPGSAALPVSAADTSKPGFVWRMHQVATGQPNSNARAEAQLNGELGDNIADPNVLGIALTAASPPNPASAPIIFEIPTTINLDRNGGSSGNFQPDDQMPGSPGTGGGTDNQAADALTWLELPVGTITMGVNSDDGFRVTIGGGSPTDKFAIQVGEYNGGRGAGNTIFTFKIEKAGLYAARLLWENGTGDSRVEWFTQDTAGKQTLINDTANGGIKAYRAVTGGTGAYLTKFKPGVGQVDVFPDAAIEVELTEGATAVDPATVKLSLDGTQVSVTPQKSGKVITVKYASPTLYAPNSTHTVKFAYTDGGVVKSPEWSFKVFNYGILTPDLKVTPDTGKPGFIWNMFANQANQDNTNQKSEDALAGLLKDANGDALANLADPNAQGVATGSAAAPSPKSAPIQFEIAGVINLTHNAASPTDNQNGNFVPDLQIPGLPATDGSRDGVAAEIVTYLELPAGVTIMGVNSDDGFRTTAGTQDVLGALLLGEFNGGRGATDTIFPFLVQEAGVYVFRTTWEQGAGGANIEWFTLTKDGTKVLVNDTAKGGVKAYRALVGGVNPFVRGVTPSTVPRQLNQPASALTVILSDGTKALDDNSIVLKVDGKSVTTTKSRVGKNLTVTYKPDVLVIPDEEHAAEVTYKDASGAFSRTVQWRFRNVKNIVLPATAAVTENFDSYPEVLAPAGWNAWNFTDTVTAGDDPDNLNSDTYKGWVVISRTKMESLKSRVFDMVAGSQIVNGTPVDNLSEGNLLYAESDVRGGNQAQFIISKPFDLSKVTNVVLSFSSLYEQNQDSVGAVEYSVDGGKTFLPIVYYLDFVDGGGDIKLNKDGSVDAVATFTGANSDTANWVDKGVAKGDNYGDGIAAPITQALGAFVAPRWNDNRTEGKRIEVFRLPQAGKKSDVRLRFAQLGTGSWYFGVDNLGFYEGPPPAVQPTETKFNLPKIQGASITLSWTGTGTLQQADKVNGPWGDAPSQANPQTVNATGPGKFYRIKL